MNKGMYRLMTAVEAKEDEIDEDQDLPDELKPRSAELCDILCERCDGEALMIVRQVHEMEGVLAWQKLFQKYNPEPWRGGYRCCLKQ